MKYKKWIVEDIDHVGDKYILFCRQGMHTCVFCVSEDEWNEANAGTGSCATGPTPGVHGGPWIAYS
jgi:hypothetical protein